MTNLEQLARIIADHFYRNVGTDRKYHCQCGEKLGDRTTVDRHQYDHIAQAIHDAGWQAPVPEFQRKINQAIVNRAAAELGIIPHRFVIGIDQQTTPSYLDN